MFTIITEFNVMKLCILVEFWWIIWFPNRLHKAHNSKKIIKGFCSQLNDKQTIIQLEIINKML